MVHKATHHFDLVNWWLSSVPTEVFASGKRSFYPPQTAERYGLTRRGERCHDGGGEEQTEAHDRLIGAQASSQKPFEKHAVLAVDGHVRV